MTSSHLMDVLEYRESLVHHAAGSYLYTRDGRQLLDMYCDNGAVGFGYNHPIHRAAYLRLCENGATPHMINLYRMPLREEAAEAICEATGFDKVFFATSGAEAVEACIKLARKYQHDRKTDRTEIWSIKGGFHGRTYGALRAGDGPAYHMDGFGPHLEGFHKFDIRNVEAVNKNAAAIIFAPVFAHHNVIPYTHEQLQKVRDYCNKHDILLIFDEIQSANGRSGSLTYSQEVDVKPDLMALAKGIAAGHPIGICLASEKVARSFTPGSHFSTFGGNPGSMVFLIEALKWYTPEFLEGVRERASKTRSLLEALPWVKAVRNAGLLFAFDTSLDARELARKCDAAGLIIAAWRPNPVRFTPLLDAPMRDIELAIKIMDDVVAKGGPWKVMT